MPKKEIKSINLCKLSKQELQKFFEELKIAKNHLARHGYKVNIKPKGNKSHLKVCVPTNNC
jgi:hypothetical protein